MFDKSKYGWDETLEPTIKINVNRRCFIKALGGRFALVEGFALVSFWECDLTRVRKLGGLVLGELGREVNHQSPSSGVCANACGMFFFTKTPAALMGPGCSMHPGEPVPGRCSTHIVIQCPHRHFRSLPLLRHKQPAHEILCENHHLQGSEVIQDVMTNVFSILFWLKIEKE